jgi:hypothetical protein
MSARHAVFKGMVPNHTMVHQTKADNLRRKNGNCLFDQNRGLPAKVWKDLLDAAQEQGAGQHEVLSLAPFPSDRG